VILNNIEFDHADIFRNLEEIETAFKRLINLIPRSGYLIAGWDDPIVRKLSEKAFPQVVSFGMSDQAEWHAQHITTMENATEFDLYRKKEFLSRFSIPLFGEHNVKNCLATIATCDTLEISMTDIRAGLSSFKNVQRRLQLKGEVKGIKVFDDFAHHPTAVSSTIQALRKRYPRRRIWAVYEPRTASAKRKVFEEEYVQALAAADRVILTPLHLPEKVPQNERLSVEHISAQLTHKKTLNWILPPNSDMLDFLKSQLDSNDIVLFMSNGDFHGIPTKILSMI
jgi:UDP-N-acetylmuramate: L-alanyl-gamma-D-glutamyl-meso-diaminopimelate ligase